MRIDGIILAAVSAWLLKRLVVIKTPLLAPRICNAPMKCRSLHLI
jgi:hypothetical protein